MAKDAKPAEDKKPVVIAEGGRVTDVRFVQGSQLNGVMTRNELEKLAFCPEYSPGYRDGGGVHFMVHPNVDGCTQAYYMSSERELTGQTPFERIDKRKYDAITSEQSKRQHDKTRSAKPEKE